MKPYFLVASLPALTLGTAPLIDAEDFLARCADEVAPADLDALRRLLDGETPSAPSGFLHDWHAANTQLGNAVARQRAETRSDESTFMPREHRGFDVAIETSVRKAFDADTPLARERRLDRARWALADTLAGQDAFSHAGLFRYAVHLHIALRWAAIQHYAGMKTLTNIVDTLTEWENVA